MKTGLAAIEAELESTAQDKPKRAPRSRKGFAAHLERVEIVIEPEIPAGCEGLEKVLIGEDVSERLDVMPAKFRVIVTRRPKYAYRNRDGVIQAPALPHIIESGIPTEALLAQIAVSKYADGLPLYRQQAIYARDQVELDRSLMAPQADAYDGYNQLYLAHRDRRRAVAPGRWWNRRSDTRSPDHRKSPRRSATGHP